MRWKTILGTFILAGVSLSLMVHIKTDVTQLAEHRSDLLSKQRLLKETLRVQQAEWAHLTRPSRLEAVAEEAGLQAIQTEQILPVSGLQLFGGEK